MRFRKWISVILTALMIAGTVSASFPQTAFAASNNDLRKRVVGLAGITDASMNVNDAVTRGKFAYMLARASKYRDTLTASSNISIFKDVPAASEYASAIRICAEHDWMSAFLGGNFKPDQAVTLAEAEKGILGLLGYSSADFQGDQYNMRHALAASLDILENIEKSAADQLTGTDCINLFYNLLRCKTTDNKDYVTLLGGTLGSDGEVNAASFTTDTSLKGPKYFYKTTGINKFNSWLPFAAKDGTMYINGEISSYESLKNLINDSGAVCYYNSSAKVVWAYSCDGSLRNGKGAVRGMITGIEYNSADTLTPSAVVIDECQTFKLTTSDMQFAFSIYGSCKVGETVTIIYNAIEDETGTYDGTVVDYIYGE